MAGMKFSKAAITFAAKNPTGQRNPNNGRVAEGLLPPSFPGEDQPLTMKQARQGAKATVGVALRDKNNSNEPVFGPNMNRTRGNRGSQAWMGNAVKGK